MKNISICMYGAASEEIDPSFIQGGEELGRMIAMHGHTMVYGGGGTGMMGACARGVTMANGTVTGIIPTFMKDFEDIYEKCTNKIMVRTMSERKEIMEKMAEAFVICPGGIGTMDEFFQILTLEYLNQKKAPIIVFNINGFFDSVLEFIEQGINLGFIHKRVRELYVVRNTPEDVLKFIDSMS